MTAAVIASALSGKRGRCACPVCRADGRDKTGDHLAVREDGGRVLVHCHAGCEQRAVIAALRNLGLWPERERPELTRDQRRAFARARAAAEQDARRAWRWSVGALERLDSEKLAAVDYEHGRFDAAALAEAAKALREIEGGGPGAALTAWRRAWAADPEHARADEAAGADSERVGEILARAAVRWLAESEGGDAAAA